MLETERLILSQLSYDDSDFILELLNEPAFKKYIGDRGVRTLEDAAGYLRNGPMDSYERHGFGLYRVRRKTDRASVGMCGLVKRDNFEYPDLGFAFLERHWANGFAYESSCATIEHARKELGLTHVIAVANADNDSSVRLLGKLGFRYERMVCMPGETTEICRFSLDLHAQSGNAT